MSNRCTFRGPARSARVRRVTRTAWIGCLLLIGCAGMVGCAPASPFAVEIDSAGGGPSWRDKRGLHAKITIIPAGGNAFSGILLYQASSRRMVVQRLIDGALEQVGYTDKRVWTRNVPVDHWQAWTQAMLFASYLPAPFDLLDPDVRVREIAPMRLGSETYRVGLITRISEDVRWAICINQADRSPAALIPLASKSARSFDYFDEKSVPIIKGYAVRYMEISFIEGVAIPTRWLVWNWDSRHGVTGSPIAAVIISEPSFGEPDPSGFSQGQNYREVYDSSGRWWR